jgi:hypothetical protein
MNQDNSRPSVQDAASGSRARADYNTPELVDYGQLRALTTGGAGSIQEGAAMTAMMKFP